MGFTYSDGSNNAKYEVAVWQDGRPALWRVTVPFEYRHQIGDELHTVTVEEGFLTDLASIPSLPFMPKPGGSLWDDAAIVHDRALAAVACGRLLWSRAMADEIFYYALLDRGCAKFTATVFWLAVRIGSFIKP